MTEMVYSIAPPRTIIVNVCPNKLLWWQTRTCRLYSRVQDVCAIHNNILHDACAQRARSGVCCTYGVPEAHWHGFGGTAERVLGVTEVVAVVRLRQLANGELHDELGVVLLGPDHVHVVFAAINHRRPALRVTPKHHFRFGVRVHHALERHGVAQVGHGDFRRHQFGNVWNTRDIMTITNYYEKKNK